MERIRGSGIDGVGGKGYQDEDEGIEPCMPKRVDLPPAEETFCFSSFREWSEGFLRIPLEDHVSTCTCKGSKNGCKLTGPVGVKGGELKAGMGSRVESAEAPVSPRSSSPRLLDLRRVLDRVIVKNQSSIAMLLSMPLVFMRNM